MLKLYQSNRLEYLADLLAEITGPPLSDPFAAEIVVVQHPGMGRWLAMHLAERTGVCANVRFPLPAGFIWETVRQIMPQLPEQDRFSPGVMQWSLFGLLGRTAGEALFQPVNSYLERSDELGRYELARQIAGCFDQYLVYRPDWILSWERGQSAVEGDDWQGKLWRRLRRSLGGEHWVDLQRRLHNTLEQGDLATGLLPERISLFGIAALSPAYLDLLQALSRGTDLHLFLLNPCQMHWTGIIDPAQKAGRELTMESEALYFETGNPLLASLGRQGRDFIAALLDRDPGTIDMFESLEEVGLLQRIQGDILRLRDATSEPPRILEGGDDSLHIHSCHSAMREVEVLRDQLLEMFQQDPDLPPDQVLVMTPEMDLYAPYIEAVFGSGVVSERIPFSLADQSPALESPLVDASLRLLEIPAGRYESSELLSLLEIPALQRRFGIAEGDLPTIRRWVEQSGIRWGRDGRSREALGLPVTERNSWQAGLDRMLLGFALPAEESRLFQGVLPYDGIEGSDSAILGGLYSFVQALFSLRGLVAGSHRPEIWGTRLADLMERFFDPTEAEEAQLQCLRNALASLQESAALAGFQEPVSLDVIRSQLAGQLQTLGLGGGFLTTGVTFCALTPMRSLPYQVICLLGMNDGAFPRQHRPPGFDLMARHFRLGDRPRRLDDRYLFLETLISARRRLYISYTGQDVRDNTPLPPSVFVSDLLDYVAQSFLFDSGEKVTDRFPVRHPLQPFSPRYFASAGELFSYSAEMAQAATASLGATRPEADFIRQPLAPPEDEWRQVSLEQLVAFFANPARYLLRERLGIRLLPGEELMETRDPFELEYFQQEGLGRRLIDAELGADSGQQVLALEQAAGRLPHGQVGVQLFQQIRTRADEYTRTLRLQPPSIPCEPLDLDLSYGAFRLTGRLSPVGSEGISEFSFNPLPASRLLGVWIRHLALNLAAGQEIHASTHLLEAGKSIRLPPLEGAAELLGELLELYWQGLSYPLHLFPKSSREYAHWWLAGKEPEYCLTRAWVKWEGGYQGYPEFANPYYQLAFPGGDVLDDAFRQLSEQLFGPLLDSMEEG